MLMLLPRCRRSRGGHNQLRPAGFQGERDIFKITHAKIEEFLTCLNLPPESTGECCHSVPSALAGDDSSSIAACAFGYAARLHQSNSDGATKDSVIKWRGLCHTESSLRHIALPKTALLAELPRKNSSSYTPSIEERWHRPC